MLEYAWVRLIAVSLLFGAYSITDLIARGLAGRNRPPKVRRPRWSHFLGFASVLLLYEAVFRDGRTLLGGTGNQIGYLLAVVAMMLRLLWSRGAPVRYPDLAARMLFYASLPIVIGSPRAIVLFTVIQAAIAIQEALQRDEVLASPSSVVPSGESGAPRHRMIPGVW